MKTTSIFIAVLFMFLAYSPAIAQRTATDASAGTSAGAGSRAYIKFDGIDGESVDKEHKNWCTLTSFSQSVSRTATGAGTTRRGSVAVEDIVCTKEMDKSTPKLMEAICTGKAFPKVEIELANATGAYLKYELKNVIITSYSVGGEGDRPMEQLSLNYEEIKVIYTEQQAGKGTGSKVEYTWNLKENVK